MEDEVERIKEIRAEHERIAVLDEAEAPARLAFETGTEGDRQRRYVLSRDRQLNRTVDTFLKVRKNGKDGAFDPVDIDPDVADAGSDSDPVVDIDPFDPCDGNGSDQPDDAPPPDIRGQQSAESPGEETSCDDERILRNEASARVGDHGEHRENEEGVDIGAVDPCGAGDSRDGPGEADGIVQRDDEGEQRDPSPPSDIGGQPSAESPGGETGCDEERVLRNEASAPLIDHGQQSEHSANEEGPERAPPSLMDQAGKGRCLDGLTDQQRNMLRFEKQWRLWQLSKQRPSE